MLSINTDMRIALFVLFSFCIACHAESGEKPSIKEVTDYYVAKYCSAYGIDPHLVHAIIEVESNYQPRAVSRKNAQGLMQLMPATQKRFGVTEPFSISENIRGGVAYLRYLTDLFEGKMAYAVAAYYSGEQSVISRRGLVSQDVFRYVRKVAHNYRKNLRKKNRATKR